MRAMSAVSNWPKSNERLGLLGSLTSMPSISTLTWCELVPRMKTEVWPPGPPVCTMLRPGTLASASGSVRRCSRSISAAVMTVTELAISRAGVATAVGLYTTCALASGAASAGGNCVRGGALDDRGAGAGARGRTTGRATTTSGRLRSGDALCCERAGEEQRGPKETSMVDVRKKGRSLAARCAATAMEYMIRDLGRDVCGTSPANEVSPDVPPYELARLCQHTPADMLACDH